MIAIARAAFILLLFVVATDGAAAKCYSKDSKGHNVYDWSKVKALTLSSPPYIGKQGDTTPYNWVFSLCSQTSDSVCTTSAYAHQESAPSACQADCCQNAWDTVVSVAWQSKTQTVFNFKNSANNYPMAVTVVCDPKGKVDQLTMGTGSITAAQNGGSGPWSYTIQLNSKAACMSSAFDYGWIFIILLLCGGFIYVVAGCIYNIKKKELRGKEACPNFEFWKDLPFLVKDGFFFVFGRFCNRGSYSSVK